MSTLQDQFHAECLEGIRAGKKLGYTPSYWIRMLDEYKGAVPAAKHLLASGDHWQSGLTRLYELKRLDLSVEYLVLDPQYSPLFTDEEGDTARRRLALIGVSR
jgi:hypothetical protein